MLRDVEEELALKAITHQVGVSPCWKVWGGAADGGGKAGRRITTDEACGHCGFSASLPLHFSTFALSFFVVSPVHVEGKKLSARHLQSLGSIVRVEERLCRVSPLEGKNTHPSIFAASIAPLPVPQWLRGNALYELCRFPASPVCTHGKGVRLPSFAVVSSGYFFLLLFFFLFFSCSPF